ncbi:MAG: hypothetical protein WCG91_02870 [Candidatus Shapirobacteria bacterium]
MFKNINIFKSIIAILIVFIPLYPKFPLTNVAGTYVAIRIDDIVIAITILIFGIYQLWKRFPFTKIKISRLFLVYFLAIIATTINAILIYQTEPRNILILHMLRRFEYMSLFFIAISAIKSIKDLYFPYVFLLISTALVDIYGYGQKYFHLPIISTMNSEFSKGQLLKLDVWTRVSSTFAGHYDLAAYLSVVLIIIGVVTILTKNIYLKIAGLIIWIASFQILTLTASRVSIFAFWGGISIALFFLKKYLWIIPVSLLVVFSIFNSKDLNQRLLATIPAFKTQVNLNKNPNNPTPTPTLTPISKIIPTPIGVLPTPVTRHSLPEQQIPVDADVGVARSGEIRFNVEWPRAITAFQKNMILGTGLGSLTLATDNDYLRSLGESGLLGFISFMSIISFFIIKTIPSILKKQKNIYDLTSIIFLGCLLTTLANAVFIDVFEASKTAYLFWIMMGIYYQLIILNKNEK